MFRFRRLRLNGQLVQPVPERHFSKDGVSSVCDEFPRYFQALLQTADSVGSARSMRGLFAELLKQFEHNVQIDYLDFSLHDPVRNIPVTHPVLQKGAFDIPGEPPVEESPEMVLRQHHTIEVCDVETDGGFADRRAMIQVGGFRSCRIFPLTSEIRTLGTIGSRRVAPGWVLGREL